MQNNIYDFRIEYRENPIGLDVKPRFSWKLESQGQNVIQTAYQIQVISGGKLMWDSGRRESSQSILVPYQGQELKPFTAYQAQVSVWDNKGNVGQASGSFETGIMGEDNWNAKWITHGLSGEETACPVFVKRFTAQKPVKRARLYATACGVYEARINGKKAGEGMFAPGWTSYHHRIQYQTYDITELLGQGNEIAVTVGNGWYKGDLGFDAKPDNYGDRTALIAMVRIEYQDGEILQVGTDTDWEVETREIRFSEIYHGETQDYTAEVKKHGQAVLFGGEGKVGRITAQESEPVRVTERFASKEKIITPKGELVFDFGQNMAGLVEVTLPETEDGKLVIRHGETLDKDGNFYTENLRTARCTDTYIYGKDQVGMTVMPHFTFHGFRYICVEGAKADIGAEHFTACTMHTDMRPTGSFSTDNSLVNRLQDNIQWGQRSNFLDVPTDCPQRDERLGWTGDAQVFCGTASYNFDTALFFRKWMRDMAAEATEEWGVPYVVPNILGNQAAGAAAWSDAATIIPWTLYQVYGDKEMLAEQFPMMKQWVDCIYARTSENGLWQAGFQYGDWLALDIESGSMDRTGGTDKYLVANAYYAYSTRIVRDAAEALGYETEARVYGDLYGQIVEAINKEFVTANGRLVGETQTACVLMLYFGLAKPEFRKRILDTLEANIGAHHNHLTTGFVGTPYLCHCLSENGLHGLADEIFMKEDFPGWLYAVKRGATTIWERWNSVLPDGSFDESGMNSLNHYAYGSIGSWLYEKVAGIRSMEPGYSKIRIQPTLTKGMTEVSASFESMYGTIRSAWSCRNGRITMDIQIPANTTAVICLPEREGEIHVGSGSYHYEYETETNLELEKYTMDSTLGELVAEELGRQMFQKMAPGMLDNPMVKFAYGMTLSELFAQSPEARPLCQAVMDALNAECRKETNCREKIILQ